MTARCVQCGCIIRHQQSFMKLTHLANICASCQMRSIITLIESMPQNVEFDFDKITKKAYRSMMHQEEGKP
jgi:hypothetical protein